MITKTVLAQNSRFKIGWTILMLFSLLMTLNHIALPFYSPADGTAAIGYAAFNLYAFIVILIPFRRFERWAWLTTWILPAGLAMPAVTVSDSKVAFFFLAVSAVCIIGQLLTMPDFFPKR